MADKMNICLINDSFPPLIDGVANAVLNYAAVIQQEYGSATVAAAVIISGFFFLLMLFFLPVYSYKISAVSILESKKPFGVKAILLPFIFKSPAGS